MCDGKPTVNLTMVTIWNVVIRIQNILKFYFGLSNDSLSKHIHIFEIENLLSKMDEFLQLQKMCVWLVDKITIT